MSPVDYSVQTSKRAKNIFHFNLLKEWISRPEDESATVLTKNDTENTILRQFYVLLKMRILKQNTLKIFSSL